jgi:hypothetical protein
MKREAIFNIWPNRDDSDHILIVTIDTDLGREETFSLITQKSQTARSMVILQLNCSGTVAVM